jgi:hypothetical protein
VKGLKENVKRIKKEELKANRRAMNARNHVVGSGGL